MQRKSISSGVKWESVVGYSRAVRVENLIHVSGTTATDGKGGLVGEGDAYAQAIQAIRNVKSAIERLGGRLSDVVRTRIYITNMDNWEQVGLAHGEFFHEIRPATTLVEVSRLIEPRMMVEIEAEAIVSGAHGEDH